MSANLLYQTLHCHTVVSDGLLTHAQVLDTCVQNKIGVVAFTDHDALIPEKGLVELKNLKHNVKFISGIEMSARSVAEVPGMIDLFHITGLFVDPTNRELKNYCKEAKGKRIERAERMLKNIQALGFKVTMAEIESYAGGESIGRPHIARAILAREENLRVLDRLLGDLEKASSFDERLHGLYQHAVANEYWQRVFDLFLSDDAYIRGVYVHYLIDLSMDEAVRLIRGAGGVALLAHWSFYKKKLSSGLIEKFCREKRIDGLETTYAFGMPVSEMTGFLEDMGFLQGLVGKYNLIAGGGGDFHRQEDFSQMINPDYNILAEKTKGMVERILTVHSDVDLRWSSL